MYERWRVRQRPREFFGQRTIVKYPAMYVMNDESLSQHRLSTGLGVRLGNTRLSR